MEQLGIYEVSPEDFALAEFVDSSKLELQRIVREGLDMLRKENLYPSPCGIIPIHIQDIKQRNYECIKKLFKQDKTAV